MLPLPWHLWASQGLKYLTGCARNTAGKDPTQLVPLPADQLCLIGSLKVAQSYLSLCNTMDCSPSGSSVHGILQARILEWVAMPFSRGSSWPRDWIQHLLPLLHCRHILYCLSHQGNPVIRELQIKRTMEYSQTPIRIVKIQNTDNMKNQGRVEATGALIHCCNHSEWL